MVAPAHLTITDFQPRRDKPGGVLTVSYGGDREGYFIYATLASSLKVGDSVPRGQVFATTELCDSGGAHVHLFVLLSSEVVDPYNYLTEYRVPHLADRAVEH